MEQNRDMPLRFWWLLVALSLNTSAPSGAGANTRACSKILAILPTKPDLVSAPAEREFRERFELRECGTLQVRAYAENARAPLLTYETGKEYPRSLYHLRNVLAFQAAGGASDQVYVFVIENGKASLALKTATKDHIRVTSDGERVVIEVPPTTYPDESGRFPPPPPPKRHVYPLR